MKTPLDCVGFTLDPRVLLVLLVLFHLPLLQYLTVCVEEKRDEQLRKYEFIFTLGLV